MKQEIAEQWAAALRSGKYQQGNGALFRDNKFCCLGVLCDLHHQQHPTPEKGIGVDGYLNHIGLLPHPVQVWAGINSPDGRIRTPGRLIYNSLMLMNDSGVPFTEIANVIESQWNVI